MPVNARDINKIRYVGYDFNTFLDDLNVNGAALFGVLINSFQSDLGSRINRYVAYGQDALAFYLDRRATETGVGTARLRTSMSVLTRQLGYKMRAAVSASTDLRVELTDGPYAFLVTVPAGFGFESDNGLIFVSSEEVGFNPGDTVKTVPVFEAERLTERFTSDGTALQRFNLRRVPATKFALAGSVTFTVDGVPWVESKFLTFDESPQFEVNFNADPPHIVTGDGIVGDIPPDTAEIVVSYFATTGLGGNLGAGTINAAQAALSVNYTPIPLTVTSPEKTSGGDDPESLESARSFAGKVFKSRGVAVTAPDYQALAGSFSDPVAGKVAVAKAISSKTASSDLTLENSLQRIEELTAAPVPSVTASLVSARAGLDLGVEELEVSLLDALNGASGSLRSASNNLQGSIATGRGVQNAATSIETDANDVAALAFESNAYLDTLVQGDPVTQDMLDKIQGYNDRIKLEASQIVQGVSSLRSAQSSVLSTLGAVQDNLVDVGVDLTTSGTYLWDAEQARQRASSSVGVSATPSGVYLDLEAIEKAVVDVSASVSQETAAIRVHVDGYLSADCKSNLISVSILARSVGGFYAAPSQKLIRSLQAFLDARKEATQVVAVGSGERFLKPAVISIEIGIRANVSESLVQAQVIAVVEGVLRDRAFGGSLYLDELYEPLREIPGKRYVNVTIEGFYSGGTTLDTTTIDSRGNLIIVNTEVVTHGGIAVSVVPPPSQT